MSCCSQYLQQHICFFSRSFRLLLDWLVTSYGMPNHCISPYKSKHCSRLWFQKLRLLPSTFFSSFRQSWIQSLVWWQFYDFRYDLSWCFFHYFRCISLQSAQLGASRLSICNLLWEFHLMWNFQQVLSSNVMNG